MKTDTPKKLRKKTFTVKFKSVDVGNAMAVIINVVGLDDIPRKVNVAQADIISIKRSKQ